MKRLVAHFALFLVVAALAGVAFVWSGLYDISATDQHLRPTYFAIRKAMDHSVERRAEGIAVPPLDAPAQRERGLALFRQHCVQCHGAPGVAPEPFSLALRPLPTPLARSGLDRSPGYLYWVVKHGIKMTGMPAWGATHDDEAIWGLVAFLQKLPEMSPEEFTALSQNAGAGGHGHSGGHVDAPGAKPQGHGAKPTPETRDDPQTDAHRH